MLSSRISIGHSNKPYLSNHNCETVQTKLEGLFGINGHLFFKSLFEKYLYFRYKMELRNVFSKFVLLDLVTVLFSQINYNEDCYKAIRNQKL